MMVPHRRLMTALACALGVVVSALGLALFIHHFEKPKAGLACAEDLLYFALGLFVILGTAPQLMKPGIVRLTPEFLEISRIFTLYRIPWEELQDAEVIARGHLPFMKITTNPPRSAWFAELERKYSGFDIGLFWWEVGVPMQALVKLLWLYAADSSARSELSDSRKVAERLDAARKRA